jgi:uncharacterized protein (DUF983 family)
VKLVAYCKKCDLELAAARDSWAPLECPECKLAYDLTPSEGMRQGGPVDRCAVCGYEHLHVRKDFPRTLGLAIVGIAAVLTFTPVVPRELFFLPLVFASVIDLALYQLIPWKVVCYVCETEYRGTKPQASLKAFDLAEATERKRLRWPVKPSGSGAPAA